MDLIKALQLQALRNVMCDSSDRDYHLRFVFRWYSKTFHTPLHEVGNLPLVDVLTAYFEERFEAYNDGELEQERVRLTETEQEKKEREAREATEKALEEDFVRETELAEQKRLESLAKERAPVVAETKPQAGKLADGREAGPIIAQKSDEPVIKMEFADEADFAAELEGFGTMKPPDKD